MTERTHIPDSLACGQWEILLADALDGLLTPVQETAFHAHKAACPACAALYDEARRGMEWMEYLGPEPEVPAGLVDRILAQTGPGHKAAQPVPAAAGAVSLPLPAWQRPGWMGAVRRWAEPRLMMTAAMAFFSIALTLNLTGVRLSDLRHADLRPVALRSYMERQLSMASVPIIRYYDNSPLVYEVRSRVQELRSNEEETPQPSRRRAPGEGQSRQDRGPAGSPRVAPRQPQEADQAARSYNPQFLLTADNQPAAQQADDAAGQQGSQADWTIRAFPRLQNPEDSKASERSRRWIA